MVLALGVVLPLLAYIAFTRIEALSGREFSFFHRLPRSLAEFFLFAVTMLAATFWLSVAAVHERCKDLGMLVPRTLPPHGVLHGSRHRCRDVVGTLGGYAISSPLGRV